MSIAMDKALMAMSLEEEDVPFDLPDLPEFSSIERNHLSLIGRILNHDCQKMPILIVEMPRKWQKVGKCRGVALSKEKFQFIFDNEFDLLDVLDKGVHAFNEWTLVIERWVENPPEDYLQYIPLWVQIRHLLVNYYTAESIDALGDLIGKVDTVAFDPTKVHVQNFVRVKVFFDVSRPLRKQKVVNLPKGGTATILFSYERIQKRCYECQRLNHEREVCPFMLRKRQLEAAERKATGSFMNIVKPLVLKPNDPLFGVLKEEQVGINPITGKQRIAPNVLEGMRQYLLVANIDERRVREERVKKSVAQAEADPMAKKSMLSLEPIPKITNILDKQKGIVFDYEDVCSESSPAVMDYGVQTPKLMASAISAGSMESGSIMVEPRKFVSALARLGEAPNLYQFSSTVKRDCPFVASSSGTIIGKAGTSKAYQK